MGYAFFARSVDSIRRDGRRLAHLRARAAPAVARAVPDGRPDEPFPRRVAMASRERPRADAAQKAAPAPPPAAVIALRRLGFGPRPGDVAAFDALGASDPERLEVWLEQQLEPGAIDDGAADLRLSQAGFTTLGKSLEQLWADHVVPDDLPWEEVMRPLWETVNATFLRAIHSRRQLFEVLVDFWHNHFNVYADEWPMAPTWVHTDRDAIRAHALGNFRQMLEAVAKTPSMLYYLNNNVNSYEDPNENYGREVMELHTLGADSYYGSIPESEVPKDADGFALGYTEETVIQAGRCLTGWTVSDRSWDPEWGNTGAFLYWDEWHDPGPKTVLQHLLPANQPSMKDGRDFFDILARHPGTARHVSRKLCRRLIGDNPPASVVDAAAAVFRAQHAAPDQIAQVVRTIVLSPAFLATWGDKVRRPFEIAVGMFRGAGDDLPFTLSDDATGWFLWMYQQTGQPLFGWHPPNGYPDSKWAWSSTSPRVMSWRLANMLAVVTDDADQPYLDPLSHTPAGVRSAREIVTFWSERILGHAMAEPELDELVSFMAQGVNPEFDLPLGSDEDLQDRLRALLALIFMSPSFLWR